ncbi:hydroxymethylbilane synthase [Streptomyces tsukubensis]|uniref:Hydroxymethylbilane synthase n=1 Tax=Streptomyces tsukubensis TaxID=83656 RepID=A0A1V4A5N8_9ACTN|nr:hydroxymethylbilane synthase [Streptomyces tsukubensis]OON75631.1 hydroxymethylbilane synthase [Streptomyces tsukubensis]QFR94387.1 hydroxymethylbilane synthase [Streptomyces tsukubensis]
MTLTVGSRASALAKAQVREVLTQWRPAFPDVTFRQRVILEGGDRDRRTSTLAAVAKTSGGSAFSTNQEAALAAGEVDVIVHSLKDLPTAMAPGLTLLPCPGPRADVRDVLCGATLADLPDGARIGTGAPRRIAQLLVLRPDVEVLPIRGNVPGRLARARSRGGSLDAVVLAAAGLHRLHLDSEISQYLDPETYPPSPGQGALGIQVRTGSEAARVLADIGTPEVDAAVRAERALLADLHGGCSVPVGTYTSLTPTGHLRLRAAVTSLDGERQVTGVGSGPLDEPEKLGRAVAADLLRQGAGDILAAIRL